jgi:hypothetical protein
VRTKRSGFRVQRSAVLCALCVSVVITAFATTYYVDGTHGDNANGGLTPSTAKKNISAALAVAGSGDVIQVASSIYQETEWPPSGQQLQLSSTGPVIVYETDPWQTDSVGDGISDGWRQYYFGNYGIGTTTNAYSCASCDANGDGVTNLQHYQGGSNPMQPSFTVTYPTSGTTIYP